MELQSVGTPALWAGFIGFVLAMLALDLGVFHRKAHTISFREALGWTVVWISLALIFNAFIYFRFGSNLALEFATGYVLEKALSVDNIFVILLIFSYFSVPAQYQHRVLFWGIIGALVMRAIFILLGAALLSRFHWIIYIFGAFLIITGIKMLFTEGTHQDPSKTRAYRFFKRIIPSTDHYHGQQLSVVENGRRLATPLFLVLLMIEFTDLIFAVDSIPAIFAVTTDPFIVFTSNIFAILGLRSLFFLLSGIVDKFHRLKTGLALVLVFVGTKMAIMDFFKVPIHYSLLIIATLIGGSIAASLIWPKKDGPAVALPPVEPPPPAPPVSTLEQAS